MIPLYSEHRIDRSQRKESPSDSTTSLQQDGYVFFTTSAKPNVPSVSCLVSRGTRCLRQASLQNKHPRKSVAVKTQGKKNPPITQTNQNQSKPLFLPIRNSNKQMIPNPNEYKHIFIHRSAVPNKSSLQKGANSPAPPHRKEHTAASYRFLMIEYYFQL